MHLSDEGVVNDAVLPIHTIKSFLSGYWRGYVWFVRHSKKTYGPRSWTISMLKKVSCLMVDFEKIPGSMMSFHVDLGKSLQGVYTIIPKSWLFSFLVSIFLCHKVVFSSITPCRQGCESSQDRMIDSTIFSHRYRRNLISWYLFNYEICQRDLFHQLIWRWWTMGDERRTSNTPGHNVHRVIAFPLTLSPAA